MLFYWHTDSRLALSAPRGRKTNWINFMDGYADLFDHQIFYRVIGDLKADKPTIIMLHEGLGSSSQWRSLPELLHQQTESPVLLYDRSGYGRSSSGPQVYETDFMHHEGQSVLPALVEQLNITKPILLGHSDGASIALIASGSKAVEASAIITIAAHIFVEIECIAGIEEIKQNRDSILSPLSKYHQDSASTFDRWARIWLDPEFARFDIRSLLSKIECPVLALQGDHDDYGTAEMVDGITRETPNAVGHIIQNCGHMAHQDQPEVIISCVKNFLASQ